MKICFAMITAVVAATIIPFASTSLAANDIDKARLGRVMWSAFQCSTLAEMSGNNEEQARLFQIGLKAGRDFLEALKGGQISRETVDKEVPVGVMMLLAGPSADFVIGRIFENAMSDAYDHIVKYDTNGTYLELTKWERDDAIKKAKAQTGYQKNNCVLIK